MVATKTAQFDVNSSSRLRQEARKYQRPAPPAADQPPQPAPRINLFERMDIPNNSENDNSIRRIIDVCPDTRYILLMIIFYVMKLYDDKKQTPNPLLTPASFVSYCLLLVYGFFLVNDYHGRPVPSNYASDFMDSDARIQLFDALKEAFVPPFLLQVFHSLTDVIDPRRPGLQYFPTLNGFRFTTDFGRFLLPSSFMQMHNLTAEHDTSRPGINAMHQWLSTACMYAVTAPRDVQTIYNGHFVSTTDDGIFRSHLFEAILTLFSPVTGKSLIRRTNMEPIPLSSAPAFATKHDIDMNKITSNPYILFLNATSVNVKQMSLFVQDFSNIIKNEFNGQFQLGAVPDDMSGLSILNHGYSLPAIPTWHSAKITLKDDSLVKTSTIDFDEYATIRKFLQPLPEYKKGKDIPWPSKDESSFWTNFYLAIKGKSHDEKSEPDSVIIADPELHEMPRCFWLQPYTEGDQPIAYSMIAGLIIESAEIDGSSVPAPDTSAALRKTNNSFLQGALPLRNVIPGYQKNNMSEITAFKRLVVRKDLEKISIDLYNLAENRLPKFDSDIEDTKDNLVIPGFSVIEHVRNLSLATSKISFLEKSDPPTDKRFPVWSPYRYVSVASGDSPTESSTYMLINFRCMYGTHVPLTATNHPFERIPIS